MHDSVSGPKPEIRFLKSAEYCKSSNLKSEIHNGVMKRISIDPITRLEGHGKIDIFLDEQGDVANAYLQIPELRGFEKFCVGRPAEDMPNFTARICGVCPRPTTWRPPRRSTPCSTSIRRRRPRSSASCSTAFSTPPTTPPISTPWAARFRRRPDRPARRTQHPGRDGQGRHGRGRQGAQDAARRPRLDPRSWAAGRVHPNWGLPGGVSRGINEEQRQEIEARAARRWSSPSFP